MRLAAMVGLGGFVATMGACAALSGLGDYEECAGTCDDAAPQPPDSSTGRDVLVPPQGETGAMTMDVVSPPEGDSMSPVPDAEDEGADGESADVSTPVEAGPDVVSPPPPPVDAGNDADAVASPPDAGLGATCGARGTSNRCTGSQICCADLSTQTNACTTSSCNSDATIGCAVPSDCSGSTPLCCAHMTLGGTFPTCKVSLFSSSCAATCADSPPMDLCVYNNGIIRLCAHDKDCNSDSAKPSCYNFQNAPESWCTTTAIGGAAGATHEP